MSKTVIITGASRGIGRALAEKFKLEGYNVVGTYLNSVSLISELKEQNIDMIKADVSNFKELETVFSHAIKKYKKIDLLINNAGISQKQNFILDVTESEFDNVIGVNLKGVFNSIKLGVSNMLNSGGKIINVSSIFAKSGGSCEAVYSASKAGVSALSRAVSEELENSKIEVLTVTLGLIDTDMNAHLTDDEKLEFIKNSNLKKVPTAKMVATRIFNLSKKEGVNGKDFKIFVGNFL